MPIFKKENKALVLSVTCESDELISEGFSVTLLSSGFSSYPLRLPSSESYGTEAGDGRGGDLLRIAGGGCCGCFLDNVVFLLMLPLELIFAVPFLE